MECHSKRRIIRCTDIVASLSDTVKLVTTPTITQLRILQDVLQCSEQMGMLLNDEEYEEQQGAEYILCNPQCEERGKT